MQYRQLGESGLTVSRVALGCNNFGGNPVRAASGTTYGALDLGQTRVVVEAALEAGVTLFDTADVYAAGGSERYLGTILKDRRPQVVIATKWGSGMEARADIAWGSRRYIRQAVEASLTRLQTDYIDLYQMHWPDPRTPISETIGALDDLVREGKIRYAGSSHFSGWQIADADWIARIQMRGATRFVAAQNHYSLMQRAAETELIPACERFGVGLLPYFPLENGLLTGKYRRGQPASGRMTGRPIDDSTYDLIEALASYSSARGRTLLDVAIGALAAKPVVASVITGATKASQILANVAALDWQPSADDLVELEGLLKHHPIDASHV